MKARPHQGRKEKKIMSAKNVIFVLSFLFLLVGFLAGPSILQAQPYPAHPIQLVIPGAPGDAVDIAARSVADELAKILKVPVLPVNKPGAGAMVATDFVAKGKKDGYTLLYAMSSGLIYNPAMSPETVPYDPLRDVEPLGMHVTFPGVLSVQAESPWKTFTEVIEYSRKNPGKFRCGSLGIGAITHFQLEMIKSVTATDITFIPFKGASPAVTALLGGHIAFTAGEFNYSLVEGGEIRVLALFAEKPRADYPKIPTLKELGYDIPCPVFHTICGPKGIPDGIVKKLEDAFTKAIKEPAFIKGTQELRIPIVYRNSKELTEYASRNYEAFGKLITEMGLAK